MSLCFLLWYSSTQPFSTGTKPCRPIYMSMKAMDEDFFCLPFYFSPLWSLLSSLQASVRRDSRWNHFDARKCLVHSSTTTTMASENGKVWYPQLCASFAILVFYGMEIWKWRKHDYRVLERCDFKRVLEARQTGQFGGNLSNTARSFTGILTKVNPSQRSWRESLYWPERWKANYNCRWIVKISSHYCNSNKIIWKKKTWIVCFGCITADTKANKVSNAGSISMVLATLFVN